MNSLEKILLSESFTVSPLKLHKNPGLDVKLYKPVIFVFEHNIVDKADQTNTWQRKDFLTACFKVFFRQISFLL